MVSVKPKEAFFATCSQAQGFVEKHPNLADISQVMILLQCSQGSASRVA